MLHTILVIVQVFLSLGLIGLILLQQGKGADAGAAFGSGASATVFGARGSASFLSRTTAVLAALFFMNSLGLAYLGRHQEAPKSVVEQSVQQTAPAPEKAPAKADKNTAGGEVPAETPPPSDKQAADTKPAAGSASDVPAQSAPEQGKKADESRPPKKDQSNAGNDDGQ